MVDTLGVVGSRREERRTDVAALLVDINVVRILEAGIKFVVVHIAAVAVVGNAVGNQIEIIVLDGFDLAG